jgi:hypothetical protein
MPWVYGNVFADLGSPDAETHFLKAQFVVELYRLTVERNSHRPRPAP